MRAINGEKAGSIPLTNAPVPGALVHQRLASFPQGESAVETGNRKLIRPSFNEFKEKGEAPRKAGAAQKVSRSAADQTNAENFYYVKQMQSKTPMVITLRDGEVLRGVIEWYDSRLPEVEPRVAIRIYCSTRATSNTCTRTKARATRTSAGSRDGIRVARLFVAAFFFVRFRMTGGTSIPSPPGRVRRMSDRPTRRAARRQSADPRQIPSLPLPWT